MASEFDETDFVDGDFHAAQKSPFVASSTGGAARPPTREELDSRVTETQQRLMELKRAQEGDRKSTRLNSSHVRTSYAVFCLKKQNYLPLVATERALLRTRTPFTP